MQDDLFAPKGAVKRGAWPSEQLAAYLNGESVGTPAIRSWASFYVWDAAQQICDMPSLEKRRTALEKIPAVIRHDVKDYMRKIWASR